MLAECMRIAMLYLGYPRTQERSHEELVPLQLRLQDDEGEVGLWVHWARHVLDVRYLLLPPSSTRHPRLLYCLRRSTYLFS